MLTDFLLLLLVAALFLGSAGFVSACSKLAGEEL